MSFRLQLEKKALSLKKFREVKIKQISNFISQQEWRTSSRFHLIYFIFIYFFFFEDGHPSDDQHI